MDNYYIGNPYAAQVPLSTYMQANANVANTQSDVAAKQAALPYAGSNAEIANQGAKLQQAAQKVTFMNNLLSQPSTNSPQGWEAAKSQLAQAGIDTSGIPSYSPQAYQKATQDMIGLKGQIDMQMQMYQAQLKNYMELPHGAGDQPPQVPPGLSSILGGSQPAPTPTASTPPPATPAPAAPSTAPAPLSSVMSPTTDVRPIDAPDPAVDVSDTPTDKTLVNTPQPSQSGLDSLTQAANAAGLPAPAANSTLRAPQVADNSFVQIPQKPNLSSPVQQPAYSALSIGGKPMTEGAETGGQWYRNNQTGEQTQMLAPGVGIYNPATPKDLHGAAYLATLKPEDQAYVSDIANYNQPIMNTRTASSGLALKDVSAAVKQANPDWKQSGYDAMQSFRGGADADKIASYSTVAGHLQLLKEAATALQNKDSQKLNEIRNAFKEQFGSPLPSNLDTIKKLVASEIVNVTTGGSGGTGGDRQDVEQLLANFNSPAQMFGSIDQTTDTLKQRVNASAQKYENATGQSDYYNLLQPQAQKLFGVIPTISSPKSPEFQNMKPGRYFKDSSGKLMVKH